MRLSSPNPLLLNIAMSYSICAGNLVYPSSKNATRYPVPEDKRDWSVTYPEYDPVFYEAPRLKTAPWADPADIRGATFAWHRLDGSIDRRSSERLPYALDADGRPLNPRGRTGVRGRGLLGRWGPNRCADPIVTRWKRDGGGELVRDATSRRPILQLVAIRRRDGGSWALPGGMVDPNETPLVAAVREFYEEATDSLRRADEEARSLKEKFAAFFASGEEAYDGYVGDPRNTDNAWLETTAYNFHDESGRLLDGLTLSAGDDAADAKWMDVGDEIDLYATHKDFVRIVAVKRQAHW